MGEWKSHKNDARIAVLMETLPGETVEEQRGRCAEYGRLVAERRQDLGHNAFALAVDRVREPHWWRDLGFVLRGTRSPQAHSPQDDTLKGIDP